MDRARCPVKPPHCPVKPPHCPVKPPHCPVVPNAPVIPVEPEATGQEWEILPYCGLAQVAKTGLFDNFTLSPETQVNLYGFALEIPVAENTGVNKRLRIVTFGASSMAGPISLTGTQTFFFDSALNYQVKWRICELGAIPEDISIGFYAMSFLRVDLSAGRAIPLITNAASQRCPGTGGPAFYRNRTEGTFELSGYTSMYVIVNANVRVQMVVACTKPKPYTLPAFSNLFEKYNYYDTGVVAVSVVANDCEEENVIATEQLVTEANGQIALIPSYKNIDLSARMITYLSQLSVAINLVAPAPPSAPLPPSPPMPPMPPALRGALTPTPATPGGLSPDLEFSLKPLKPLTVPLVGVPAALPADNIYQSNTLNLLLKDQTANGQALKCCNGGATTVSVKFDLTLTALSNLTTNVKNLTLELGSINEEVYTPIQAYTGDKLKRVVFETPGDPGFGPRRVVVLKDLEIKDAKAAQNLVIRLTKRREYSDEMDINPFSTISLSNFNATFPQALLA